MNKDIQQVLQALVQKTLEGLYPSFAPFPAEDASIDLSTNNRFGDLSANAALRLSRRMKRPPVEIARELAAALLTRVRKGPLAGSVSDVKAEGAGFVNFYLSDAYFYAQLRLILRRGARFAKANTGRRQRVLIEFVSANPTGPLSVAHARQAVVGDVLGNVLSLLGFAVKREYYLNDEGNQINILGRSVELRLRELSGEAVEFPEDHYQGEYIYDIAKKIKAGQAADFKDFSGYGLRYILDIIKQELKDFGVRFDYWFSQKHLRESGKIEKALGLLKKKGFLYEDAGALWFKSTSFGDDKDRVVIKSDGSYTYLAPDIAYHREKYRRRFHRLINMWGPDHHGYISRLKAAVAALGQAPETIDIIIIQLASIFRDGKPVQMSTRRGQYITLREVLDEVGRDAARFFFLMRRTSSHLDFDLAQAKKQTPENPVYYVQYAHARISSILSNAPAGLNLKRADTSLLREKEELALIKKLWQYPYILNVCRLTLDPYMLTVYLQEAAETFHRFYDKHRVLSGDVRLTGSRVALIEATRTVIAAGLELMGISRPEKM